MEMDMMTTWMNTTAFHLAPGPFLFFNPALTNSSFSASRLPAAIYPATFNEVEVEVEEVDEGEGEQHLVDEEDLPWREVVTSHFVAYL